MSTTNQPNTAAGTSSTPANDAPAGTTEALPISPKGSRVNRWIWRLAGGMAATLAVGFAGAIGGYYAADPAKVNAIMRPSETFNAALATV